MMIIIIIIIIIICLLKDVAVSSDSNIIQKDAENKVKYKNLSIEIQIIWYRKWLFGSQESLLNELKRYMEMIPG
jgi:hypothetical protein